MVIYSDEICVRYICNQIKLLGHLSSFMRQLIVA